MYWTWENWELVLVWYWNLVSLFFSSNRPLTLNRSSTTPGFWLVLYWGRILFMQLYNPLKSWCRNPKATVPTLRKHPFMGSSNFIVGAISTPGNHWLRLRRLTHGNIWKQHVPGMRNTHLWRAAVNQNLNPSESGPHSHLHRPRRGRPTCSLAKLANQNRIRRLEILQLAVTVWFVPKCRTFAKLDDEL